MLLNQDVESLIVGEQKTYTGDWRQVLGAMGATPPTILESTWAIVGSTDGLTIVGSAVNDAGQITSVTLRGTTAGRTYTLKNTVTLSDAQVRFRYGVVDVVDETSLLY